MHCLQLDFPDNDLMEPSNVFQIRAGYILSSKLELMGISVMLLCIGVRFNRLSLHKKADMVYQFIKHDPEQGKAFEDYFLYEKRKKATKHLPKNIFMAGLRLERSMADAVKSWIENLDNLMRLVGYTGLLSLCNLAEFEFYFFQDSMKSTPTCFNAADILTNKEPEKAIDKSIWLLPESIYHEDFFKTGCIKSIDEIQIDEPFLIECLRIPDLNLLTIPEMKMLKEQLNEQIQDFKKEASDWAMKCYKEGSGTTHFKTKLMPLVTSVQKAIDDNPILNHWATDVVNQPTTTIYFGEANPELLWKYHKTHATINDEMLARILAEYTLKNKYTVPVMVFAHNTNSLKLQTESVVDIENRATIFGVKKSIMIH